MGPQRDAAITYLTAQVARYRKDLAGWRRRSGRIGSGLANSMIVEPLQGLIDDAVRLVARLRSRPVPAEQGSGTPDGAASPDADP